jgi:hypothetical protein
VTRRGVIAGPSSRVTPPAGVGGLWSLVTDRPPDVPGLSPVTGPGSSGPGRSLLLVDCAGLADCHSDGAAVVPPALVTV